MNQQIKLSQILKSYLLNNYGNYEESKLFKNVGGYEQIFTVIEKNNDPVPKNFSRNGTALKLSFKDMIENIWSENDIKNVLKLIITHINFKTDGYRSRMATREMLEFLNITSNTVKFTNILIDYTIKKYYKETLNYIYNYSFDSSNKKIQNIIKTNEFSIFKILNTTTDFNNFKSLFTLYINEKYNYTASFFSDRNLDVQPYIPEKGTYKFIISNNTVNLVISREIIFKIKERAVKTLVSSRPGVFNFCVTNNCKG